MLRIQQLKLRPDHSRQDLDQAVRKALGISKEKAIQWEILRQSVDARKKPEILYVYTVDVSCEGEQKLLKKCRNKNVSFVTPCEYRFPECGKEPLSMPPVIIGTGPAGLFCGLMLARAGFHPVLIERGEPVELRKQTVESFWKGGRLDPESNVQFGEGGAGTFSDGKLNTLVKDRDGRGRFVLRTFTDAGASPDILYSYKPHIGTDILASVIRNIRNEIISLGGTVLFSTKFSDIEKNRDGSWTISLISGERTGRKQYRKMKTRVLVLAIGHSARDTFHLLKERDFPMECKAFAVGVRVEHLQSTIDRALYGEDCPYDLGAAPYKLTHRLADGRGVYSFCMCPGGYVVNASSEEEMLAVNGMSYHDRGGRNANSAIVVTVSPEDYGGSDPLDGLRFQRKLEHAAYLAGGGRIPAQRFEDFCMNRPSDHFGKVLPQNGGMAVPSNVRCIFPEKIADSIEEGIRSFEQQIRGFSDPDTLLSGVESRTSSPVRILRNDSLETVFPGIYPCGEGAGYAGGITSAAMDGIRVAEAIAAKFHVDFQNE